MGLEDSVVQIGVGGMFALLVIREVLGVWSRRNGRNSDAALTSALNRIVDRLSAMENLCRDTHNISRETRDWHAPDAGGTQSWKGAEQLRELRSLGEHVENVGHQVSKLREDLRGRR